MAIESKPSGSSCNSLGFPATLLPHGTLLAPGLFDESIVRREDWDLWLRIAHKGRKIAAVRRVVRMTRIHAGGQGELGRC